ncbi:MAG TPA: hypothetical protein PLA72_10570 [Smithellaceae bacterium]|nr:hypothetical protein [Smithellaceae bacterium]
MGRFDFCEAANDNKPNRLIFYVVRIFKSAAQRVFCANPDESDATGRRGVKPAALHLEKRESISDAILTRQSYLAGTSMFWIRD